MKEKAYTRHSAKDLIIWCDDMVYMRVAGEMKVISMPCDEAVTQPRGGMSWFTKA